MHSFDPILTRLINIKRSSDKLQNITGAIFLFVHVEESVDFGGLNEKILCKEEAKGDF